MSLKLLEKAWTVHDCLQTWTHMSENAHRLSRCSHSVTRSLCQLSWDHAFGASLRILLTVEHCDHCEHEIHNRVWVLELELNELRFWVLLWSFSCGSEPNFVLRKILREQEVQLPPFKMPHTVPMQPLMSYPFMASVLSWILGWQWWMITSSSRHCHVRFWWLVTGRNPGRFGWSFLLVTPCLTSASSIIQQLFEKGGACKQHPLIVPMVFDANLEFEFLTWAQWTPILSSPLVFFVWFWTYNFILRKIL